MDHGGAVISPIYCNNTVGLRELCRQSPRRFSMTPHIHTGGHILDRVIRVLMDTHKSAIFGPGFDQMLNSNACQQTIK